MSRTTSARRAGLLRLGVVGVHAVVAHLRIGEHHDLPRIGGIGDDFQIAFHRGVEADLTECLAGRAAGGAGEHRAVLQHEQRRRTRRLRSGRPQLFRNLAQRFRPFRDSLAFASCASPAPRRASLRLRTLVNARPVPQRRPQKKRPRLARERSQAHKMKFAHRTLPVSRYRPLKVIFEHKTP